MRGMLGVITISEAGRHMGGKASLADRPVQSTPSQRLCDG